MGHCQVSATFWLNTAWLFASFASSSATPPSMYVLARRRTDRRCARRPPRALGVRVASSASNCGGGNPAATTSCWGAAFGVAGGTSLGALIGGQIKKGGKDRNKA
jgi:hypothetical protein